MVQKIFKIKHALVREILGGLTSVEALNKKKTHTK